MTALDLTSTPTEQETQVLRESSLESLGLSWQRPLAASAIRYLLDQALADGRLTEVEERQIESIARMLAVDQAQVRRNDAELSRRIILGRARDGRLPTVRRPIVALRPREVCHLEVKSQLLEGPIDGLRLGARAGPGGAMWVPKYVGFSDADVAAIREAIPRSAWMADDGILTVTSQRLLFRGRRGMVEATFSKVAGFALFRDGLLIGTYDPSGSALFSLREPDVVVGIASAAAQRYAERRHRKGSRRV